MILQFGNSILRAIEESDAELLKIMMNEPQIEATTAGWNQPVSTFMQKEWIRGYRASDTLMRWMVELSNGVTIGMVSLTGIDWKNRFAEISYKRNPYEKNRLKGDMKDAVYAVVRYAFLELNLNRLESFILEYNESSQKLIRHMGFSLEGTMRNRIYKNGSWHNEYIYGLLREDFIDYPEANVPWKREA